MTVLVGVKCTDGVVIGADSMATSAFGQTSLLQVQTDKLAVVGDRVIIASSGAVGLGQRFTNVIKEGWEKDLFKQKRLDIVRTLSRAALDDFKYTGVLFRQDVGFSYGALVAVPMEDRAELVEFNSFDFQPEIKSDKLYFVSMGSGQMLAEPFMAFVSRVLWDGKPPTVQTAMFGVYWALQHAIKIAPGGVGEPIRLSVLRREKGKWVARILEPEETDEQLQHIEAIESLIHEYPAKLFTTASAEPVPEVPQPQS